MSIVKAENVKKYYGAKNTEEVRALDGVSLSIEEGEFMAIVGTSGSGKSTLLHILGGLDNVTEGEVTIRGQKIGKLNETKLTIFRRRNIGFVFQSYNLVPVLTVYENIVMPLQLDGKEVDEEFVQGIIGTLGLKEKCNAFPNQLSGGQQQRVAIARALAAKPALILADEPTGNLDSATTMQVIGMLKQANERYHQTIVMITHNEDIAQLCHRIIHIEDGKITGDSDEK